MSRSTKMSEHLPQGGCGQTEFPWTASQAGSPAKTSRSPADVLEWKVREAASGQKSSELFAKYDRRSSSWRTSQACLLALAGNQAGGLAEFSETWPRSGLMRSGIAYRLPLS